MGRRAVAIAGCAALLMVCGCRTARRVAEDPKEIRFLTSCVDLDASLRRVVSEGFSSEAYLSGPTGEMAQLIGHRLFDLRCPTPTDIHLPISATSATCHDLAEFKFHLESGIPGTAAYAIQTTYAVNVALRRDSALGCGVMASHAYTDQPSSS